MNVDKKMSPAVPIRTSAKGGQNEIGVPCPFISSSTVDLRCKGTNFF